jgi:hypothetical protein
MFLFVLEFYFNFLMFNMVLRLYWRLTWAFFSAWFCFGYLWLHLYVCVLYNSVKLVVMLTKEH